MLLPHSLKDSFPSAPSSADIENFCIAARGGDVAAVEKFLDDFGAAIINAQDSISARAITWAAFSGNDEVVKLLLDRGADINAHGTNGKPALSWAAELGKLETVALLLDRGASLDEKDDSGLTPVDWARRSFNSAVTELIDQHIEEQARRLREVEERKELQKEQEARAAVAERLRKLKESSGGKIKLSPQAKPRNRR